MAGSYEAELQLTDMTGTKINNDSGILNDPRGSHPQLPQEQLNLVVLKLAYQRMKS